MTEQDTTEQQYRIERDTMGEIAVPADALYRAQTQRAIANFPISGHGLEGSQIRALGLVKAACAPVNGQLGMLDPALAEATSPAADEVAAGEHDSHFPVDVFQSGSGTSSNMNANEVIATLASRTASVGVHPNDHVNASQSSNDVFSTTIHLAATEAVAHQVIPALVHLASALRWKSPDCSDVVRASRLMGALAREYHPPALARARQLGDRPGKAEALCGLGHVATGTAKRGLAWEFWRKALEIYEELGVPSRRDRSRGDVPPCGRQDAKGGGPATNDRRPRRREPALHQREQERTCLP